MTTGTPALQPFVRQRTMLLTTYRRDGTPVGTPVSVAVEADRAFVRTSHKAWKVKRLRNNPEVEIAPSTFRGRPTGPALRARARLLAGDEAAHASRSINRKYPIFEGVLVPVLFFVGRARMVHYELTPLTP